jgi:POT family proton-dependent oligopeptide transporter
MTKLAPQRLVGQMMGVWFMGAALGNLIAGVAAGYIEELSYPSLFSAVAWFSLAGGVLFLVLTPVINRLAHGVR